MNNRILRSFGNKDMLKEAVAYRHFLYSVIVYMITDSLWGVMYEFCSVGVVYTDTVVYFMAMVLSVLVWSRFVVKYLKNNNIFDTLLNIAAWLMVAFVFSCLAVNLFKPVLFSFTPDGVYIPERLRYVFYGYQIVMFALTTIYTSVIYFCLARKDKRHHLTVAISGFTMTVFIWLQTLFPLVPFYSVGCLLAGALIHSFVSEEELQKKNNLLAQALDEAQQANKAKTVFLKNMSHEIRTPINTILGMNEIIRRESSDEKIISCVDNIETAGSNLLEIISSILDFSRMEFGNTELLNEEYYVADLINSVLNLTKHGAEEKGLELRFEVDPEIPQRLVGDELKIKQVISNLLNNAVKFTEKGKITFRANLISQKKEQVKIRFSVTDTGIGIKSEDKDKLFTEFERLDTKRTRSIEGAGLGLPIAAHLLSLMDSKISVESIYDMGSEFSFELIQETVDDAKIGEQWMEKETSKASGKEKTKINFTSPESRILLVDDTPLNLEVICGLLAPTKIKIDTATSGAEGIQKFGKETYDLVFLDYFMPQMDGIETLTKIKADFSEKAEKIPIISLTASAVAGEREHMLSVGFTDFMTKPVILSEMLDMLLKYIPQEKIHSMETAEKAEISNDYEGIPKKLLMIDRIDVDAGIDYCGTPDTYMMALEMFVESIDEKTALLEDCLAKNDISLFTITVHALKSSSLTIGIADFSAKAKELELAGKDDNRKLIAEKFPEFVEDFLKLKKIFKDALE
ncbi:ATP-binding protein [Butyrivibrio sp. AE3004]|uniref:ATP-binding protein n=1 Tax=Butyrivibrio sp. AE3004 TaxID=1506994 RepID=UPI0018CC2A1C|nr:ATP-binding protein [Butyrivibrio sp. AE3004]